MVKKLDRLGFKGQVNDYFRSYLTDRQINVVSDGQESVLKTVNIGLPQGSVSAPWLFSLYINDMRRTSDKLNFIHFADETTIYRSGPDLATLCNEITNKEATRVDDWLKANRLSLNIDKANFMILTHGKYDERDINIKIRDTRLRQVKCTKFLGLMIDNRLSYCDHLTKLQKQLSTVKGVLLKLYILPLYIIKQLYYALFHSRMAYGVAVWGGSGVTNVNIIRSICNSTRNIFYNKIPANSPKVLAYDDVYEISVCDAALFFSLFFTLFFFLRSTTSPLFSTCFFLLRNMSVYI